jgi:2-oxoisovalerate dehydrogenase E2 component (dihydrolipoyl transacylase)
MVDGQAKGKATIGERTGNDMKIHVVKVPDIGEGIAEVELVEWHVQAGDIVVADQVVADVMTDKATVEIPSPVSGRVLAVAGKAGEKLAVGSELLRLDEGGGKALAPAAAAPAGMAPVAPAVAAPAAAEPVVSAAKALASPSVRRHARELGLDLGSVAGSGPEGRILHEDLARHAGRGAAPPAGGAPRYAERSGEQAVPVIGLRRQIALRMQDSIRRIPHFTYVEEIDVTELEALRARLNEVHGEARGRLTVLPFLMRAIVLATPAFPQVNARYDDENGIVTRCAAVHIGIATQTRGGLMVPTVRHAEARDLWSSAAEIARLAEKARTGKATREELSGSTITITSLGSLGGIVVTPIINAPEVAIVGVNRIVERPVVRSGAIVPRRIMNLSSSFDHRVVDGQDGAEFVQALRGYLECPAMLFVD